MVNFTFSITIFKKHRNRNPNVFILYTLVGHLANPAMEMILDPQVGADVGSIGMTSGLGVGGRTPLVRDWKGKGSLKKPGLLRPHTFPRKTRLWDWPLAGSWEKSSEPLGCSPW